MKIKTEEFLKYHKDLSINKEGISNSWINFSKDELSMMWYVITKFDPPETLQGLTKFHPFNWENENVEFRENWYKFIEKNSSDKNNIDVSKNIFRICPKNSNLDKEAEIFILEFSSEILEDIISRIEIDTDKVIKGFSL